MNLRPMLATKHDPYEIKFPIILQPKYDGIRCLLGFGGAALSRTLLPLGNEYIRNQMIYLDKRLGPMGSEGIDGEIVTYTDGVADHLNKVNGKVSKESGTPTFKYHIFDDYLAKSVAYKNRYKMLMERLQPALNVSFVWPVENVWAENMAQLEEYEELLVSQGYEGMIGRDPNGFYKYGRSTVREGKLLKFKRFTDAEAVIIGFEELEHNENEQTLDERGLAKRSSHKDGKVAGGTLGALVLDWDGIEFKLGTGYDDELRDLIWRNRDEYLGRSVTFKYKGVGTNGKPLIASFKAFRDGANSIEVKPKSDNKPFQGSLF